MSTLAGTVLRGMRARTLLSLGSILLTALAIGSAVLGPIFAEAVTNSYVVARLNAAAPQLTGVTWRLDSERVSIAPSQALDEAETAATDATSGPFGAPVGRLESRRYTGLGGAEFRFTSRPGQCDHLDIEGRCPKAPGEVLVLVSDLDTLGLQVGQEVPLPIGDPVRGAVEPVESPVRSMTVVGSYTAPDEEQSTWWFNASQLTSIPPLFDNRTEVVSPLRPAPFLTVPGTFDTVPARQWAAFVDVPLVVPPDATFDDLRLARTTAAASLRTTVDVAGGDMRGVNDINDLPAIDREVRLQQATARSSIAPAVLSLLLVALALLMRLLMAACELRVPELALASLRGLGSRQLWALGVAEPLGLVAISVPIGAALGYALSWVLARAWLVPGLPVPLPWVSVVAGVAVVVGAAAVSVLAVRLVLVVSLASQLTGVRRPKATGRAGLIAQLVLVALAGAVLASKLVGGAGQADPDVTDLVLPVLLAVVAGLGATHLIALVARWWTRRRSGSRSLSGFVSARAISRRQEGTLVILPLTAAIAVAVFGVGVFDSAATWRGSVAATASPAANVWSSPLPIRDTVALTHEVDPGGTWAMAAATIASPGLNLSVVDAPRLAQVAEWPESWTPGRDAADVAKDIGPTGDVPVLTGREASVTLDNQLGTDVTVELRLSTRSGVPARCVRRAVRGRREHRHAADPVQPGLPAPGPDGRRRRRHGDRDVRDPHPQRRVRRRRARARRPRRRRLGALTRPGRRCRPHRQAGHDAGTRHRHRGCLRAARLATGGLAAARPVLRGVDVAEGARSAPTARAPAACPSPSSAPPRACRSSARAACWST